MWLDIERQKAKPESRLDFASAKPGHDPATTLPEVQHGVVMSTVARVDHRSIDPQLPAVGVAVIGSATVRPVRAMVPSSGNAPQIVK
jgi:hypothetical protein